MLPRAVLRSAWPRRRSSRASGAALDLADDLGELFGEVGGRAVISCAPKNDADLRDLAIEAGVPVRPIGSVGGTSVLGVELDRLRDAWEGGG